MNAARVSVDHRDTKGERCVAQTGDAGMCGSCPMCEADRALKVLHVVHAVRQNAIGVFYPVLNLCLDLLSCKDDVRLLTIEYDLLRPGDSFVEVCRSLRAFRNRLGISSQMHRELALAAAHADIIHTHSLWRMANVYPGWVTRGRKCRLVVSPHGTLAPEALQYSALAKRVFWSLVQGPAVRHASCFHATAEQEYEDIRSAGLRSQPVCIIPIGVEVPELKPGPQSDGRTILFLGRMHHKKGVDILLNAWQAVSHRFPEWDLRIAGPDDGCLPRMQALARRLNLKRVEFCGPLYGEAKLAAYREADLFVLPTRSENFGSTVAEALAAGTPAVVTKKAPWSGLERYRAGWWIDIGLDPLVGCLEEAMKEPAASLAERGARGREWMMREYSWARVGKMMRQAYRWLIYGGETPAFIRLD
jgi:glycosyltransferase involved in cell wall biosynthesis